MSKTLSEKERIEVEYWRDSELERPGADIVNNLVFKLAEARILLQKIERHHESFAGAHRILEIGAGQGWAACIVKRRWPEAHVAACDISPYAIASLGLWERVFQAHLDEAFAAKSYALPVASGSLDLVFCFEAAHHFVAHRRTFVELARVLQPGGRCLYLHEPTCSSALHWAAQTRVNRKRPEVPEDVLIRSKIEALAADAGLQCETWFDPTTLNRGPAETVYYSVVSRMPLLQRVLPCTADFVVTKPQSTRELSGDVWLPPSHVVPDTMPVGVGLG
jgi:SAM-dependent methyltransferase